MTRAAWAEGVETHREIKGRQWRTSDPRIPEELRQALVNELMSARRAVRDADSASEERDARDRVQDAKVALGERGLAWWLDESDPAEVEDRIRRARRAIGRARDGADAEVPAWVAAITSIPREQVDAVLDGG